MTILARFAPSADGGRWLLTTALVILGLVVAATLVARVALRRRAAARHGVWSSTLVLVVASPVLVAVADRWEGGRWTLPIELGAGGPDSVATTPRLNPVPALITSSELPAEAPRDAGPLPPAVPAIGPPPLTDPEAPRPAPVPVIAPPGPTWTRLDAAGLAVLLWGAGVALGLIRLVRGFAALSRLWRDLRPLDSAVHPEILEEVRAALGLDHLPPIFTSDAIAGPFVAGISPALCCRPDGPGRPGAPRRLDPRGRAHPPRRLTGWPGPAPGRGDRLAAPGGPRPQPPTESRPRGRFATTSSSRPSDRPGVRPDLAGTLTAASVQGGSRSGNPRSGSRGAGWTLADRVAGLLDPERNRMTRSPLRVRLLSGALLIAVGLPLATLRFDRPTAAAAAAPALPGSRANLPCPGPCRNRSSTRPAHRARAVSRDRRRRRGPSRRWGDRPPGPSRYKAPEGATTGA